MQKKYKDIDSIIQRYKEISDYYFDSKLDLISIKNSYESSLKYLGLNSLYIRLKNFLYNFNFVLPIGDYEKDIHDYMDDPFIFKDCLALIPGLQYNLKYRSSSHGNDKEVFTESYHFNNNGILNDLKIRVYQHYDRNIGNKIPNFDAINVFYSNLLNFSDYETCPNLDTRFRFIGILHPDVGRTDEAFFLKLDVKKFNEFEKEFCAWQYKFYEENHSHIIPEIWDEEIKNRAETDFRLRDKGFSIKDFEDKNSLLDLLVQNHFIVDWDALINGIPNDFSEEFLEESFNRLRDPLNKWKKSKFGSHEKEIIDVIRTLGSELFISDGDSHLKERLKKLDLQLYTFRILDKSAEPFEYTFSARPDDKERIASLFVQFYELVYNLKNYEFIHISFIRDMDTGRRYLFCEETPDDRVNYKRKFGLEIFR